MRYSPSELERLSMLFDTPMKQLEDEIMTDIVRRIKINGEITRSADWQIHRLYELRMSKQDIENSLQNLTGISPQEVQNLYSRVIQKGYAEDEKLYRLKGKPYIPFAENKPLQQFITATAMQTSQNMYNLTQSMGFAVRNTNGLTQFLPIAQYYQDTLDNAMLGITSGAFDYNTVLKKTVAQLTNSGLRTIDYASGHSNSVEVATRRAVMTGFNQIVAKVNEENAEKLKAEYFEISWHSGARPSHWWGGKVVNKDDLVKICGLGDVQGLCGANCYHSYSPFFPEFDVRTYTDEQLEEMNRQENTPVEFGGKQYTKYEALQRQRRLETTMRAERQKIKLLQEGGASEDDIITARAKYRVTSSEYTRFSKAMNLPQQRERVTVDGLGNIGVGKYKVTNNIHKTTVKNSTSGNSQRYRDLLKDYRNFQKNITSKSSGNGSGTKSSLPILFGTLDFNDEKAIINSLESFEKSCKELTYERCRVITSDGKIWDIDGSEGYVITETIQSQQGGSSLIGSYSYHNHPKKETHFSFSGEDAGDFLSNAESMAKASDYKYAYTMTRTNETLNAKYEDIKSEFKSILNNEVLERAFWGEVDFDENGHHETMIILSQKYKFNYERKLIDDK